MAESYVNWLRGLVGPRKVFLPFVTVILRDQLGRVLVQRRTDFDFWGLPGGVLELDEDIEHGARRELVEETGLEASSLRLVGIYTDPAYDVSYPNGDQVQQFTFCLEGRVSGGQMRPDGVETFSQKFVTVDESLRLDLPPWYRDMLAEAEMKTEPMFRLPYAAEQTADQIAAVRPFIGHAPYAGVGAAVVLVRRDGRILMLTHRGEAHWRIPAGFTDLGENAAHTAVRELHEELGISVRLERLLGVHATVDTTYANGDQIHNVGVVFLARWKKQRVVLDLTEIGGTAWMTPDQALECVHPSRVELYRQIRDHIAGGYFVL